jgi:ABC-type methionine transport system ATPase subunit
MIDLRQVSKTFRKQDELVDAVRDISLTIAKKKLLPSSGRAVVASPRCST